MCQILDSVPSIVIYFDRWCVAQYGNVRALQWCAADSLKGVGFIELAAGWDNPFERQREMMQVIRSGRPVWQGHG